MRAFDSQLALKLSPQEVYRIENFLFVSPALQHSIEGFCKEDQVPFLYLYGDYGYGKTHLLLAICNKLESLGVSVAYVSIKELVESSEPPLLQAMATADVLCLDDIDAVTGLPAWEEALFHLFNQVQIKQGRLIVTAEGNPASLPLNLADLRSRLATGLVQSIPSLTDEQKQQALTLQAQVRGIELSDEVAQFLLRHYGRSMVDVISELQRLDAASLQAKRKLTIPFVKQVLGDV